MPIIHSNIGCFNEISNNGKYAVLFKKKDAKDLASKLYSLLKNPNDLKKYSKSSTKKAKNFSFKKYYKNLEIEYKKILSK